MSHLFTLLRGLSRYRKETVLAPAFMMLSVLTELALPAIMQRMIDIGVAGKDLAFIGWMSLAMGGAAIVSMAAGLASNYFAAIASQSLGGDLRRSVFERIMRLSRGNVDRLETGQLVTRATNDVTQVQNTTLMGLKIAMRAPMMLVGGLVMALLTSPGLSVVIWVMIPVLLACIAFLLVYAFPLFTKVQERIDDVNRVIAENLSGIRVIKAFVRATFERSRFAAVNDNLYDTSVTAFSRISLMMPLIMIVANGGIVGALWLGGVGFARGTTQIGQIQAFINYLGLILFGLIMLAMVTMMMSRAEASARRIREILSQRSDVRDATQADDKVRLTGHVEFRNVCFDYERICEEHVLHDLNFTIEPGEKVAILGATGSGKTSLVHLIPRFYDVTAGAVLLDGIDVRDIERKTLRRQVATALQDPILFSGTVADNLRMADEKATAKDMHRALAVAQADDFVRRMPDGLETKLGARGVNLSGGQKQRISMARAVLARPTVLILDDATSAVDVETETLIQQALDAELADATVIAVAQRISTVLDADKILVLDEGTVQAIGDHETLLATSELYRDIYQSQLGGEPHGQN